MNVSDLRREYDAGGLRKDDLDSDPIAQFQRWFDDALSADMLDANAMTLATADAQGAPSARVVLVKGIDANGITFYTHYDSDKGRDLEVNPRASVVFYWAPLHRQVRMQGAVTKVSREKSQQYFAARPRGAQIGAAALDQSRPLASRQALDRLAADIDARHKDQPIPCPGNWGGYRLVPDTIEFWQGRPNRLHDRFRYARQQEGTWLIQRLAP
jgi:pyridoxamine 5'-phosphate oxidase